MVLAPGAAPGCLHSRFRRAKRYVHFCCFCQPIPTFVGQSVTYISVKRSRRLAKRSIMQVTSSMSKRIAFAWSLYLLRLWRQTMSTCSSSRNAYNSNLESASFRRSLLLSPAEESAKSMVWTIQGLQSLGRSAAAGLLFEFFSHT